MISYYTRPGEVYVKINSETFEIVNVLSLPTQKTISKMDNQQYYELIMSNISSWPTIDEQTFNAKYQEVLSILNNL